MITWILLALLAIIFGLWIKVSRDQARADEERERYRRAEEAEL